MEEWKNIPGFEGYYQASNLGNIKRLEGKVWHTSKAGKRHLIKKNENQLKFDKKINGAGYYNICLSVNNKVYYKDVHRLIALTFLGNGTNLQVNHKDGNKLNNKIENLEFVTRLQNIRHSIETGLSKHRRPPVGELNPRAKITAEQAIQIKNLLIENKLSVRQISNIYNISIGIVYNIKYKRAWTSL